MKIPNEPTMSMIIVITLFLGSCNDSSKKLENAKEDVKKAEQELTNANNTLALDVAEYRKQMNLKIAANNARIDELNKQLKTFKDNKNKEKEVRIADLKKRNSELETKIKEYNQTDKSNWDKFKQEFNSDMESLGNGFADLTTDNVK